VQEKPRYLLSGAICSSCTRTETRNQQRKAEAESVRLRPALQPKKEHVVAGQMNRRIFGMLAKRLDDAALDEVEDRRDDRGKRWLLGSLLRAVVGALLAGSQSLAEVERLSEQLSRPVRGLLGIGRRLPDTTLRSALCTVEPWQVVPVLHTIVRQAQRRKALESSELPFGVVSLDGKGFSIPATDDWYAQRQTQGEGKPLLGVVRSITATLTSSPARPIIDVTPVLAFTNEMGAFETALDSLCGAYQGLFQLVTYDAGACSGDNAALVRARDLHYLFGLTAAQPTLLEEAQRWLGSRKATEADATSEALERSCKVIRRLFLGDALAAPEGWQHLRTVLRIQTQVFDAKTGELKSEDERYLISSLPRCRLTAQHWLLVARNHWGVETSHQILDTAFAEDDHPWIESNPRAALVVALLRRIAYTLLTLFRSITQRSDERRAAPWKTLMNDCFFALVTTTPAHLERRPRATC
jgi:hypothetical protein